MYKEISSNTTQFGNNYNDTETKSSSITNTVSSIVLQGVILRNNVKMIIGTEYTLLVWHHCGHVKSRNTEQPCIFTLI